MAYTDFDPYLQKDGKEYTESESSRGTTYLYRWNNVTDTLTIPVIGETWEDGRPVTDIRYKEKIDNSEVDELFVSTVFSVTGGGPSTTTLEQSRYQIRWNPVQLPLIRHPYFQPGATGDLFTAISSKKPIEDVVGWEYEQDPNLKAERQYRKLGSDGQPTGVAVSVTSGQAIAYVKLRQLGFDSYTEFLPVWSKVSVYRGEDAPGTGTIGQYTATPDGSGYPSGYEWIKSADSAERIGNQARWQRSEEWSGFTRVYFDIDSMNPAGHTIP